jgi:RNA-directed DNA polymerase
LSTAAERSGQPAHAGDAVIPGLEVSLWEQMLSPQNLGRALRRVRANAGAAGVDGMTTEELVPWLREHWPVVREALDAGTYRPSPVRRVVIPKPGGTGERLLGVPTCLDRLICQAIAQVLTPVFDPFFSGSSFGFRPGRSAHQAVRVARRCVEDGLEWVVDIDLDRFFDRVQFDVLMARVARTGPPARPAECPSRPSWSPSSARISRPSASHRTAGSSAVIAATPSPPPPSAMSGPKPVPWP